MNDNLRLYSVYDRVAGNYSAPFAAQRDELAIRFFRYSMAQNPIMAQDSELYFVGEFDPAQGAVYGAPKPDFVCRYNEEVK